MVADTLNISGELLDSLEDVLYRAWSSPFTTRSDFSRETAEMVGFAAEKRFITLIDTCGSVTTVWRLTSRGLTLLEELKQ